MAAASCLLTEDQFLCSICLDVFTDPVSIPCGHNFCKNCITQHWNINVLCQCPNCMKIFPKRPELQVNTFISEMSAQFRQSAQQKTSSSSSSSEQQVVKPGEVPCDYCTGTKLKALKSCLVCLSSYCETHLEPHLTKSGLKKHQLIDPVENLEERKEIKHPVELSNRDADREMAEGVQVLQWVAEAELERVQQYTEYVFLNPVILINHLFTQSSGCRCALSLRGFTSGKFYFEVQVGAWSTWTLGVTKNSNIKREILLSPRNGYWTVCTNQRGGYCAAADPSVGLSVKSKPEKVGVFVDYEEGLVSFYDADTAALIYSFTDCCFTKKLYPFFSPCCNDGVSGSWWAFFLREHKLCLQ